MPKRAAHYPVLANAISAIASRHLNVLSGLDDDESAHYVNECLKILITNLEDPLGHWDENFLAAVVLLRSHEEFSGGSEMKSVSKFLDTDTSPDVDERHHLFGTTRLLNSISSFVTRPR